MLHNYRNRNIVFPLLLSFLLFYPSKNFKTCLTINYNVKYVLYKCFFVKFILQFKYGKFICDAIKRIYK